MGAASSVSGAEHRAERAFHMLDASGDGAIDSKELGAAFLAEGESKFDAAKHARDWIREIDESAASQDSTSKLIDMDEFKKYLNAKYEESPEVAESTLALFEKLGKDFKQARDKEAAINAEGGKAKIWASRNEDGALGNSIKSEIDQHKIAEAHADLERRAESMFKTLDLTDSGNLTAKELMKAFQAEGDSEFEAAKHARDWIREMDQVEHDKMISLQEFKMYLIAKYDESPELADGVLKEFSKLAKALKKATHRDSVVAEQAAAEAQDGAQEAVA